MSREFQKDMDEYLRARKRAGFNIKALIQDFLPKKSPAPVDIPQEVEVYHEEHKAAKPKESVLGKLFKKEEPVQEELLRTKMQAEDAVDDLKEVAKFALGVMKKLPDEQLHELKQSPEFEKLKHVLKKHELIK